MTLRAWLPPAAALVLLGAGRAATAMCVSIPAQIVEYELRACQPAEVAMAERIAGADLWWLRGYLDSIAYGNPGVVLLGKRLRLREAGQGASIFSFSEGDGMEEQVFYTSSDPDFCGTFEGLETLTLQREEPCCDVIPPASVACVLRIAEVRPVLEEPAELEDAPVGLGEEGD